MTPRTLATLCLTVIVAGGAMIWRAWPRALPVDAAISKPSFEDTNHYLFLVPNDDCEIVEVMNGRVLVIKCVSDPQPPAPSTESER